MKGTRYAQVAPARAPSLGPRGAGTAPRCAQEGHKVRPGSAGARPQPGSARGGYRSAGYSGSPRAPRWHLCLRKTMVLEHSVRERLCFATFRPLRSHSGAAGGRGGTPGRAGRAGIWEYALGLYYNRLTPECSPRVDLHSAGCVVCGGLTLHSPQIRLCARSETSASCASA